ncbi:DUF6531 domain-containing protein [Dyella silvae]|uniref:DUF6531 domain-containing protein n=1 Tax=Dyella silvae TaxID=2994424 RepID=UPI002263CF20|nr:DUF6531 domain-containing protein [Dyella silvae]
MDVRSHRRFGDALYQLISSALVVVLLCAICLTPGNVHAQSYSDRMALCQSDETAHPTDGINYRWIPCFGAKASNGSNYVFEYYEARPGSGPWSSPINMNAWLYLGPIPGKATGSGCTCEGGKGTPGGETAGQNASAPAGGNPVMVKDPINAFTGNKYQQQDDFNGGPWLTLRRFYNSDAAVASTAMGAHWRHSFDQTMQIQGGSPATVITLYRPDGRQEVFTRLTAQWTGDADNPDVLVENDNALGAPMNYTVYIAALHIYETYSPSGLLQSAVDETGRGITLTYSTGSTPTTIAPTAGLLLNVTESNGRQLNFTYDTNGYVQQIVLPDGGALTYSHDTLHNLQSVQYPDGKTRQYVYNEVAQTGGTNLPNAMTGIVDETGSRFESTTYDSSGRATSAPSR